MENFAFTISLADALTGPAKRMQSALLGQRKVLLANAAPVVQLEKSVERLGMAMQRSAALGDVKTYQKQGQQLSMLKVALDQADKSELKMAKHLGEQAESLGETIEKTKQLTETYALVGEAVLKVGEFFAEGVIKAAEFTIEQVEMKSKLTATLEALGKVPGAGKKTYEMLDDLSSKLPQTKDQLGEWTKAYMAMGVTDLSKLRSQLTATASAQALMGDEGVSTFTALSLKIQEAVNTSGKLKLADKQLANLAKTGVNVTDVAKKMGLSVTKLQSGLKAGTIDATKFGNAMNSALTEKGAGPLAHMGMSLEVLGAKFKENIGDMFEDVDIEPFLSAMKDLLSVFSQSTSSGQEMKSVLSGLFTELFSVMGKVVRQSHILFIDMIILGLKAYIALKPLKSALVAIGIVATGSLAAWGLYTLALGAMAAASWIAAGGLSAAAAAGWAALSPILVAAAPFIAFGVAVLGVYEAFKHWGKIKEMALAAFSWVDDLTGNLISGLVNGIISGLPHVLKAISGLGHAALNKLSSVFDSHSPSRAFKVRGLQGGQGLAGGFDASVPMVKQSVSRLGNAALSAPSINAPSLGSDSGAPPIPAISAANFSVPQQAPTQSSAGATGGKQVTVHVGGIHIDGAGKDAEQITEQAVTLVFERIALETA